MENKYMIQWKTLMGQAEEALSKKNFSEYEKLMMQVDNAYENLKNDASLTYECVNFGMSQYIFEDIIPDLFVKEPKLVKEFITLIKEDKNLNNQFLFYKSLEACKSDNVKEYINEALRLVKDGMNMKTISESNKKLANFISSHDLKPSSHIPSDMMKLYESCDYLFKHSQKLTNLNEMNENLNVLVDYVSKGKANNVNEGKAYVTTLLEKATSSDNLLNEEERSLVYDIMDHKSKDASSKREKLYNKFKNECIDTINKLLKSVSNEDKEGLLSIKEQLLKQSFSEETIVQDIAKLLEIRDVLMSE